MTRMPNQTRLDLQARDFALLRGLFESRVMTLQHLSQLYFGGRYEYAKKRVQRLKETALIVERATPPRRGQFLPALLSLGREGLSALASDPAFARYPRTTWEVMQKRLSMASGTLEHELDVVDVKVAFARMLQGENPLVLERFSTWPRLYEFSTEHLDTRRKTLLQPDGYFTISRRQEMDYAFFFELDRSSEVRHTLAIKAYGYQQYYRSGGFALRQGGVAEEYKDHPFRVLLVVPSEERRNNVAERLLKLDGILKNLFWLATLPEVLRDPLGEIWMTLGAYLQVTEETLYDPRRYQADRRVIERDRMVESNIVKRRLIDS